MNRKKKLKFKDFQTSKLKKKKVYTPKLHIKECTQNNNNKTNKKKIKKKKKKKKIRALHWMLGMFSDMSHTRSQGEREKIIVARLCQLQRKR